MEYKGKNIEEYTEEEFHNLTHEEQIEFLWLEMELAMNEIAAEEAAAVTAKVRSTEDWPDVPLDVSTDEE